MQKAIYRQYRPMTFDRVLGQDHIVRILKNQIIHHKIGHAYLFSGSRGTGKTSCAKIMARAINCLQPKDGNPCNVCQNCRAILEESSLDVIEMDAASNRRIDDIRELRDKVIFPPANLKYKVYIIDEAHMITNEGFNALLKIMEEPPKHLVFILATTEMNKLPPTILSRCQRFEFKRIGEEEIAQNISYILKDMDMTIEPEALQLISVMADGAMRDGLSLLDQLTSFGKDHISLEDVNLVLGTVTQEAIFKLTDQVIQRNSAAAITFLEQMKMEGKDIYSILNELIKHYRSLMIFQTTGQGTYLDSNRHSLEKYATQAAKMSLPQIIDGLGILVEFENRMKVSENSDVLGELAILKLMDYVDRKDILSRLRYLERELADLKQRFDGLPIGAEIGESDKQILVSPDEKETKPSSDQMIHDRQIDYEEMPVHHEFQLAGQASLMEGHQFLPTKVAKSLSGLEHWKEILDEVKERLGVMTSGFLGMSTSQYREGGQVAIVFADGDAMMKNTLNKEEKRKVIEDIIGKSLDLPVTVNFVCEGDLIHKNQYDRSEIVDKLRKIFGEEHLKIEP